jgi:cyclase
MKRTLILCSLVAVGVLTAAVGAVQQAPGRGGQAAAPAAPSAAGLTVDKVKDNLYVLRGGGGNTAVFITATGVTLVDTKIAGWGQPIIERVRELTDKPVTRIINTHTHYDHVSGNVEFPPTVDVVTHENTARLMPEMRPVMGRTLPPGQPDNIFKENNGRNMAKRTFKDRLSLGSGAERIELYYLGRAHTSGDAFVVFSALRVMHTGDAFPNKGIPIMDGNNDGSAVEYADTVAKAAALPDVDTVITGHFNRTVTMADVKMYADFNREFVNWVRATKKAGGTMEDAMKWTVPARFIADGYTQPTPAALTTNVTVAWSELK